MSLKLEGFGATGGAWRQRSGAGKSVQWTDLSVERAEHERGAKPNPFLICVNHGTQTPI